MCGNGSRFKGYLILNPNPIFHPIFYGGHVDLPRSSSFGKFLLHQEEISTNKIGLLSGELCILLRLLFIQFTFHLSQESFLSLFSYLYHRKRFSQSSWLPLPPKIMALVSPQPLELMMLGQPRLSNVNEGQCA